MDDYSKKENFEKTLNISKEKLGFPQNSDPTKFNHQEFLTNLKNVNFVSHYYIQFQNVLLFLYYH